MDGRKRALDTTADSGSNKKLKSDIDVIAQKRAEFAAKLAAMKQSQAAVGKLSTVTPSTTKVDISAPKPTAAPVSSDVLRKIEEAKRRVAERSSKISGQDKGFSLPTVPSARHTPTSSAQTPEPSVGAGLNMAAHPLLLDTNTPVFSQSKKDRYKPMQPKFASIKANARNAPPSPAPIVPTPTLTAAPANPYYTPSSTPGLPVAGSSAAGAKPDFEGAPRERAGRKFHFNPKGKYIAIATQMRQDQQLEALRQRIATAALKAGLSTDLPEKSIKRPPPPEVEWWDASLLPTKNYSDIEERGLKGLNIRTPDSAITIYVQHPIPIPAPSEKREVELKPLMLTKKEQKKMRRLRRKAELEDKRDRIRMGLLPPDPPKVRLANLMKVLTSDAVQDPTRVEARVRREVAMRKHTHEKMNAERKLTDEQRREKLETKKADEEKKGTWGAVYRIGRLTNPSHVFKVRKNAEQMALSGLCIFHPSFVVVYVEGAPKYMRQYKRLFLHRMKWDEEGTADVEVESDNDDDEDKAADADGKEKEKEEGKEISGPKKESDPASDKPNTCTLIWEGALRQREFSTFKSRHCQTDREAKDLLGEKMKGYWDVAKNWVPEED